MGYTIKVSVQTNKVGSDVEDEFPAPDDWANWTEEDRESYLEEVREEHVNNYVDSWAEAVNDEPGE